MVRGGGGGGGMEKKGRKKRKKFITQPIKNIIKLNLKKFKNI